MPGRGTPIYIDADLIIAWLADEETTPKDIRDSVDELIRKIENGHYHLVMSTILKPECASVKAFVDALFRKRRHVTPVNVTIRVADRAREYMGTYSLKPNDAIHLATATLHECECLYTKDANCSESAM